MSNINVVSLIIFVCFIILQSSIINCRPHTQKIVVHGHEWTVPNEPGWEDVLQEAEPVRHKFLTNCASSRECRMAAELLRKIFLKHRVSAKYYDDSADNEFRSNDMNSIFKWG
ncbi:unnamed protein product [Rotaria sp. Silwood2]|nr:unnamed protein product [Rotaria sp. Silwood2]CAF3977008.1 unnamed protein product [Rotaria sp. Silwood2]